MATRHWLLGCIAALAFACGGKSGSNTDGGGSGSGTDDAGSGSGTDDAGNGSSTVDAPPFGGQCTPNSGPQCSNCIDDDGDGYADGNDPQCTGPADNLENSFQTGISGDNVDATDQDCFFDGNSGAGNDGCSQHTCCLLHAADQTECAQLAPSSNVSKYVKAECYKPWGQADVPSKCSMNCGPLVPPGCDCFGCCTVCNGTACADILISNSPNCPQNNLNDPACISCQKTADCGNSECAYDGVSCTPCPGQCTDPNNAATCDPPLPSSCGGQAMCPSGITECATDGTCPTGTYCQQGCCVGVIQ